MFSSNTQRSASAGRSKNFNSLSVVAWGLLPPAPFTRQSRPPRRPTTSCAVCAMLSRLSTSHWKTETCSPCSPIRSTAALPASGFTSRIATWAPQPASAAAISLPRMPAPPVMATVRPEKSYILVNSARSNAVRCATPASCAASIPAGPAISHPFLCPLQNQPHSPAKGTLHDRVSRSGH